MDDRTNGSGPDLERELIRVHGSSDASPAASCSSGCRSPGAAAAPGADRRRVQQRRDADHRRRPRRPAAASAAAAPPAASASAEARADGVGRRPPPSRRRRASFRLQLGPVHRRARRSRTSRRSTGIKVKYDKFPTPTTQIAKIRSDGKGGGYDVTLPDVDGDPGPARATASSSRSTRPDPERRQPRRRVANPGYDPGNKNSMPVHLVDDRLRLGPGQGPGRPDQLGRRSGTRSTQGPPGDARRLPRGVRGRARSGSALDPNTTDDAELDADRSRCSSSRSRSSGRTRTDDIGDLTSGRRLDRPTPGPATTTRCSYDKPERRSTCIPTEGAIRGSRHDGRPVRRAAPGRGATCGSTTTSTPRSAPNNSNYIGYMGPNAAAQQYIDPAILSDPDRQPDQASRSTSWSSCSTSAPTSTSTPSAGTSSRS